MSDSFMSSMTFASSAKRGGGCDCDECGIAVPGPILKAMREHKRQRLETGPLKRTQERRLICRQDGLAIWRWTMPLDAEPLIEYGATHRVVLVEKLPGKAQSIGKGIIGSSDEEKTRKTLDWEEGKIYFVPANGGKAVGWIHTDNTETGATKGSEGEEEKAATKKSPALRGHAVLQTVKIPVDAIDTANPMTQAGWVFILLQICKNILEKNKEEKPFYSFSDDCLPIVRRALQEAEEKAGPQPPAVAQHRQIPVPEPVFFNPLLQQNVDGKDKTTKSSKDSS